MVGVSGDAFARASPDAGARRISVPAILLAFMPAVMLLVLMMRPVWDVDVFWQLKLGELTLLRHAPVLREPFAALHLGEPIPRVGWAAQAIMAAVRLAGGWTALRLFDGLCWAGGFWVVAWACRRRGARAEAVLIALALAFALALATASIRPQSFAALGFGLLLALLRLDIPARRAVPCGMVLLAMWQNLHPSISVALVALAAHAAPGWFDGLRGRAKALPWTSTLLAAWCIPAMFLTPDGLAILRISAENARSSMAIHASEWLPLWVPANLHHGLLALLILGVTGLAGWRYRREAKAGEILTLLAMVVLTLTAYRFVLFLAIALVPVVARFGIVLSARQESAPRGLAPAALVLALIATPVLLPTRFAPDLPLAAAQRLKAAHVRGTVYGDFPYGGMLIDTGWPDWRVAYDGRYYRYSSDEWQLNGGVEAGYVPLVDVTRHWRPAAFLLNDEHNRSLAMELSRSSNWCRIFEQRHIVVYVPASNALCASKRPRR